MAAAAAQTAHSSVAADVACRCAPMVAIARVGGLVFWHAPSGCGVAGVEVRLAGAAPAARADASSSWRDAVAGVDRPSARGPRTREATAALARATSLPPSRAAVAAPIRTVTLPAAFSDENVYVIRLRPDGGEGCTRMRTWFHFALTSDAADGLRPGRELRFVIEPFTNQESLFLNDHRPVVRSTPSSPAWQPLASCAVLTHTSAVDGMPTGPPATQTFSLHFRHMIGTVSPGERLEFAFSYPYSLHDVYACVSQTCIRHGNEAAEDVPRRMTQQNDVYCAAEVLTSVDVGGEQYAVPVMTITGAIKGTHTRESALLGLFPTLHGEEPLRFACQSACTCSFPWMHTRRRPLAFPGRRVVLLSARVHPGETPASYALEGFLSMITSSCPRGVALRSMFVFVIVPVLNPYGVHAGHFRYDHAGVNLNRVYGTPDPVAYASIYAYQSLAEYFGSRLFMILDMHAHAGKKGCFVFGNHLENIEDQITTLLYPRLVALHSPYMDISACEFSQENMHATDGSGSASTRAGSARVALHRLTGVLHCYTLECHYTKGTRLAVIPPAVGDGGRATPPTRGPPPPPPRFSPSVWANVGRACALACLELEHANPWSRLPKSSLKSLAYARRLVGMELALSRSLPRTSEPRPPRLRGLPTLPVAAEARLLRPAALTIAFDGTAHDGRALSARK